MPEQTTGPTAAQTVEPQGGAPAARPASDYARPDLEPTSEAEILERKNPLGYSVTEPTEEEIEGDEDGGKTAGGG